MLLKNPFFFGLSIFVIITLQVGISILSFRFFLEGDGALWFACFIIIPLLALLIALYALWFRKQRKVRLLK